MSTPSPTDSPARLALRSVRDALEQAHIVIWSHLPGAVNAGAEVRLTAMRDGDQVTVELLDPRAALRVAAALRRVDDRIRTTVCGPY